MAGPPPNCRRGGREAGVLILSRKRDEKILIGDRIEVSVVEIRGDQVKLGISAPSSVKVYRYEVYQAIQEENRQAAAAGTSLPAMQELLEGEPTAGDRNQTGSDSSA